MPIGLDPSEAVPVWLERDKKKPLESRPTFLFHFLTTAEVRKVRRLTEEIWTLKDDEELSKKVDETILVGLVGWHNMTDRDGQPITYSPERLDVLTFRERLQLAISYPSEVSLAERDLGKSDLPAESAAASSVNAVPPAV